MACGRIRQHLMLRGSGSPLSRLVWRPGRGDCLVRVVRVLDETFASPEVGFATQGRDPDKWLSEPSDGPVMRFPRTDSERLRCPPHPHRRRSSRRRRAVVTGGNLPWVWGYADKSELVWWIRGLKMNERCSPQSPGVTPAQAGVLLSGFAEVEAKIPAFAGMTGGGWRRDRGNNRGQPVESEAQLVASGLRRTGFRLSPG
jgi:hypothetical protein